MDRIATSQIKLTKEIQLQNKLNFCQSHLSRAKYKLYSLVGILIFTGLANATEPTPLDEFEPVSPTSVNSEQEPSEAESLVEVKNEEQPYVEIKQRYNLTTPYKQRRGNSGWMLSIGAENSYMSEYASLIDNNVYEDLFGTDDLTLVQAELEFKYNFKLGAISLSAGFGMGSITDDRIGEERKLEVQKKFLGLNMYFDNLMKEPYAAPYVGGQVWLMDISEEALTSGFENATTVGVGFSYKIGVLFQLNWLDPEAAQDSYTASSIENTYLDFFLTQSTGSQDEEDPDTSTDFNWGAGLKIEF